MDRRELKPLALHHQVHVSLCLAEAAFSGLPDNTPVVVGIQLSPTGLDNFRNWLRLGLQPAKTDESP